VRGSLLTGVGASAVLLAGVLGIALGWVPLVVAALGAGAAGGVAFAWEARSLAWTIGRALTTVARRARLHYAPPLRAEEVQK